MTEIPAFNCRPTFSRRDVLTGLAAAGVSLAGAPLFAATALAKEKGPLALLFQDRAAPGAGGRIDNSAFTTLLSRYVSRNAAGVDLFDYKGVTAEDRALLQSYLDRLTSTDPRSLDQDNQFAYWANLYNALTLEVVLDAYPVESIRDIRFGLRPGPWRKTFVEVAGVPLSLDNIEHDIMRVLWDEPRIHYAVNCASIGCPNLQSAALEPEGLEAELTRRAKEYVNDPRGAALKGDRLTASRIYKWFQEDFGGTEAGVVNHLATYADAPLKEALTNRSTINDYRYDWSLNDVKQRVSTLR